MAQGFGELRSPPRDSYTVCWLATRQLILVKVFSGVLLARTDPFGFMTSSLGFSHCLHLVLIW